MSAFEFFCLMALVFFGLERAFPAHRQATFRREWWTDLLFYGGQVLLWNGLVIAGLMLVARGLNHLPLGGVRGSFGTLPLWLQIGVVIVLCDISIYWFHRASHAFEPLWRFHRVHHTAERLDWLAAYREHPVDGFLTRLVENLPALLLGFRLEFVAGFVAFRGLWGLFIHSNVALRLGPLEKLIGSPRLHHWHHEKTRNNQCNFANLSPLTDLAFGTFHDPKDAAPETYGLTEPAPRPYAAQLWDPMVPRWMSSTALAHAIRGWALPWVERRRRHT